MAGSRLDRIGSIFSRATGLLKAGGVSYQDRPLWYDIYRVFPPKYEPHIDRESEKKEVVTMFYHEDKFRALFFKKFGPNPRGIARNLTDRNFEEPSQPFVKTCMEIASSRPEWNDSQVFEAALEKHNFNRVQNASSEPQFHSDTDDIGETQASRRQGRKIPTVTAQSLLSLFKEAKEEQTKATDGNQSSKSHQTQD